MKIRHYISLAAVLISVLLTSCSKKEEIAEPELPAVNKLYINEVLPGSGGWVEIYNPGIAGINLKGYTLLAGVSSLVISQNLVIPAGSFLSIMADDSVSGVYSGLIFPETGSVVSLKDTYGRQIDQLSYPGLPHSQSIGLLPDGSSNLMVFEFPSSGLTNNPGFNKPPKIWDVLISNTSPWPVETVIVHAQVWDDHNLAGVLLHLSFPDRDTTIEMYSLTCGTGYSRSIPPLPVGTNVKLYISALDDSLSTSLYPYGAPASKLEYTVVPQ